MLKIKYLRMKIVRISFILVCLSMSAQAWCQCDLTVSIDGFTTINAGESATLSAAIKGGTAPYTLRWSDESAEFSSNSSVQVSPQTSTNYYVTVIDANECLVTATVRVTVAQSGDCSGLTATITASKTTITAGESVTLTADVAGGIPPYTYSWNNDAFTTQSITVTLQTSTDFWLAVTDANGCDFKADHIVINVNSDVEPEFDVTLSTTEIGLEGGTIAFTVTSNFNWQASEPYIITPGLSINPAQGNAFQPVTGTITIPSATIPRLLAIQFNNPNDLQWSEMITIYQGMESNIRGCTDPFSLNYNPKATVDDGSCTYKTIDAQIEGCTNPASANYNPVATVDNGSCIETSIPQQPVYGCTDPKSLNFNPKATEYDGSCVYAGEENIFNAPVEDEPVETVGTQPIENCALNINAAITEVSITQVDVLNSSEVRVHWVIKLEGGITILYEADYTVNQSGITLFYLSIICKDVAQQQAHSLALRAGVESGVTGFTVSATANVDLASSVGVRKPNATSNITVYPNPTTGIVNIGQETEIKVYSLQGALLQEIFGKQVNLSAYPNGIYQLRVNGKTGKVVKK
jgi:hypothetical protein